MASFPSSLHLLALKAACGFTSAECKAYGFSSGENLDDALNHMSSRQFTRSYRRKLHRGKQWHFLEDKWATERCFEALGIPVPRTYGLLHPHWGTRISGEPLRGAEDLSLLIAEEQPGSLFLKPRGGRMGRHVLAAKPERVQGELKLRDAEGAWTTAEFLGRLPRDSFSDYRGEYLGWLVQERIVQHPEMARINADTLNSIRLVTFLAAGGECQIHYGAVRAGRRDRIADNWDQGGLAIELDPATGVMGRGMFKGGKRESKIAVHPDTGARFEGMQVPMWDEVVELVKTAARHFSGTISVGWDVGVTPEGPVLIEGNATWALRGTQLCTKRGCLTPEIRRELAKYGLEFPERLPSLPQALATLALRKVRG